MSNIIKQVLTEEQLEKFQAFMKAKGLPVKITKTSTDSKLVWKDGPVIQAMRKGTVVLLDEIDQAKSTIMALQTIAQGKPYYIKKTNEIVHPAPGFNIIATSNTKGNGDGMDSFVGAQVMNKAFIDRFQVFLNQDYPTAKVEEKILMKLFTGAPNALFVKKLVKIANAIRQSAKEGTIEQTDTLTTRRLAQIIRNYNVFNDEKLAFEMAVNRFDSILSTSYIEIFNSVTVE